MSGNLALLIGAVVMIAAGALFCWMAQRQRTDRLRPNPVAGLRTPVTLSSDAAWYAAHRATARETHRAGIGAIVGGALSGIVSLVIPNFAVAAGASAIVLLGSAGWMLAWVLIGVSRGHGAAREALGTDRVETESASR